MELQDLIDKAKTHVSKIQPRDASVLSPGDFPRVHVRDAAMVCFESEHRKDRVFIFLDRETGEFITLMYSGGGASAQVSR